MSDTVTSVTVAAVHAAPVYMDTNATTTKIIHLIEQAAEKGIELLGFPEAFLPGYPYFVQIFAISMLWNIVPLYVNASVTVDGSEIARITQACAKHKVAIVLGFSERISNGTAIFNSQIFIDRGGQILGVHRKLQPTLGERMLWSQGGGKSLRAFHCDGYVIGGLACSENIMNGARQALIDDGEQIHVGSWPALSAFAAPYVDDQTEATSKAQALFGQTFVIAASDFIDETAIKWITDNVGKADLKPGGGWSAVISPSTVYCSGPHTGNEEKFVQATIQLSEISIAKVLTDSSGSYKRPEVLEFRVNRNPIWPDE